MISKHFKRLNDAELDDFCEQVISRTKGNKQYSREKDQVTIIEKLLSDYKTAKAAAADGSRSAIAVKNEIKKELIQETEALSDLIKFYGKSNETYFIQAGFNIHKRPVKNNNPLETPSILSLKPGILTGTVEGIVSRFPTGVKEVGVVFSIDNWKTEQNGTYSSGKTFILKDLPIHQTVEVKVCYLGTYQRKSNYSIPKQVFVL